jgi:hypothetical protein
MFGKKKTEKENQGKKPVSFLQQILKNDTEFDTIGSQRSQSTPMTSDSPLPNGEIKAKKKRSFFGFMTKDENLDSPSVDPTHEGDGEKKKNWRSGTIMGFTSPMFSKKKEESTVESSNESMTIEVETVAVNEEIEKRSGTILSYSLDFPKNEVGFTSPRQEKIMSPKSMTSPKFQSPKILVEHFNRFENPMYKHLIKLKNDELMFPDMNQKEENPFPSVSEFLKSSERNHGVFERNFEFCETRVNVDLFINVKEEQLDVNELLRIIPNSKKKLYHIPPSIASFIDSFQFKESVEFDKKSLETTHDLLILFDDLLKQSESLYLENMPNVSMETFESIQFLSKDLKLTEEDLNPRDKIKMLKNVENPIFDRKKKRQHTILNSVDVTISRVIESFLDHEIILPNTNEPLYYIESVNDLLVAEENHLEQSIALYLAGILNEDREQFEIVDFLPNPLELDLNEEEFVPRDVFQFKEQQKNILKRGSVQLSAYLILQSQRQ